MNTSWVETGEVKFQEPAQRLRGLRVTRYLSSMSGLLLLVTMLLIAWFYNQQATRDLVDLAARHNVALNRFLTNTVWAQYGDYLADADHQDAEALRTAPETAGIANAVAVITKDIPILKVKFYSTRGRILFSTDPAEIGEDYSDSKAFGLAAFAARTSSELTYGDSFTAFSGETFHRDVVETYLPKVDATGNVTGVAEIYTDVSEDTSQIRATTFRLALFLTAVFSAAYAILVTGIVHRAFEPIRLMSEMAAEIGPETPGTRLPVNGAPREIAPLVRAVNGALDRLDRALDAERRFTADAAHELLTPLSLLRAQIDAAGAGSPLAPLRGDVDAMTDMVSQLLMLAELESRDARLLIANPADARAVAQDVVSVLAPLALDQGKALALAGTEAPVWVECSPELLGRTLRNLIDNAIAHTMPGTEVEVEVRTGGEIRVTDHGPGVPPGQREMVFHRFWRGNRTSRPGAGLGLSIVRRIVDQVGGVIWVEDAPGGGASFVMRLPTVRNAAIPV